MTEDGKEKMYQEGVERIEKYWAENKDFWAGVLESAAKAKIDDSGALAGGSRKYDRLQRRKENGESGS